MPLAIVIIAIVVRILNLWSGFSKFSNQILMSSSLLIVVLGFVFQEGLSNIVHGLILLVFKPFEIGDRVRVTVNGTELTGYVTTINLRSTVIRNLINSASLIVPNAAMDTAVIENAHYAENAYTTGLIDLSVTYESDLDLAVRTAADVIAAHPAVRAARAASAGPMVKKSPIGRSAASGFSAASSAAFLPPSIATVATGMPLGIITVDRRASMPSRAALLHGTPMTGSVVFAAIAPAR